MRTLEAHSTHAAHSAVAHRHRRSVFLRAVGNHGFRGDQQACDRSRILQRTPHDLRRIDDALGNKVTVLSSLCIEAEVVGVVVKDLANNNRAIFAGILEPRERGGQSARQRADRRSSS